MAAGDQYRLISPTDKLIFDSSNNLVGIQSPNVKGNELRLGAALTAAEVAALQALISSGVNVAPTFLGAYGGVAMDAGSGNVMPTMRVMVNAATDVIAGEQISGAGPDTVVTTISGASTTGEVIVLTATVDITSVHVGFSTGSSPTISSDTTITVNELVRFDFDGGDDVRTVRVYFSPPRSSGRYIDVSCVGQQ